MARNPTKKSTANIIHYDEGPSALNKNKGRMSTLTSPIQYFTGSPSYYSYANKRK